MATELEPALGWSGEEGSGEMRKGARTEEAELVGVNFDEHIPAAACPTRLSAWPHERRRTGRACSLVCWLQYNNLSSYCSYSLLIIFRSL